jgi:ubiquinone/menaquinone biosynthesis C-methylase UbiE
MPQSDPIQIQRQYYAQTASSYDQVHVSDDDEHAFALHWLSSLISAYSIQSVLDVGSGTGRAINFLNARHPELKVIGLEPVAELRAQGYAKGIAEDCLVDGDATELNFADGTFDLVCEFGALHHMAHPDQAVAEMLRVSRKGIFISDCNNFGQGSRLARFVKQAINALGLWNAYNWIATKGKRYHIAEGDGLCYTYSVFNDLKQIQRHCSDVHICNSRGTSRNHYRSAGHVALFGVKT